MSSPLIFTAFGNDPAAIITKHHIETAIARRFPGRRILWGYSARTVARALREGHKDIRQPAEILSELAAAGQQLATLQPLHLFPGHEFHALLTEVREVGTLRCRVGLPLLASPDDYRTLLDLLAPLVERDRQQAVLLVGHGTRHPVWPAYLALENMLQRRFGQRLFVGVIEHYPASDDMAERILASGCRRVLLIPLLFVAGLHFRRDIRDDNGRSWRSRLQRLGLEVEVAEDGLGLLPGMDSLVARHIAEAEATESNA